ncbi:Pyrogallol hydroxytransferase small subunit [Sporomusa silvacetica DSM 10669]|uniref:Pyrogallol hydroxytransferase small subunit n=1 Tax=Sporomusa silvacetica DSM 10669 TaxID=1123289 RepID=A0ABZ3IP03_9FIRM|nr:4Fe-4S dicluster domain-containing protein [Sporomusa silvacetica]OZC23504.1 pyrogallol hydroxytransferase small subunit [Sporomusa silvacetica DSM 10669]
MKVFVIDVAKCNGCYGCQVSCKDEHCDNEWLPYAKIQPETGHFWMKINEKVMGSVPKVKMSYVATPCMHCENAPCMEATKNGSVYRREDGLVIIDPEKSKGQKQLVDACPYGAIYWNEKLQLPQKCTGCAHLVDEGKIPRCMDSCPTDAIKFGEEAELAELIGKAEVMKPELGLRPRVYYLNLPKNFVAGAVFDPIEDECLKDAKVTLTDVGKSKDYVATTDSFGDFWFKRLEAGTYALKVEKEGFCPFSMKSFEITESTNVGDIALNKMLD